MTLQHLKFKQLSELIDDNITDETKEEILKHLKGCSLCNKEYQSLNKCMDYLSELKNEKLALPCLGKNTIIAYKTRMKKKQIFKTIPLIAASILVIAGTVISITAYFTNKETYLTENSNINNETQQIISSIRDSNGSILKMNNSYIDGAVKINKINNIKKILNEKKLKYKLYKNPIFAYTNNIPKNIEDVSLSENENINSNHPEIKKIVKEKDTVIIRIFR